MASRYPAEFLGMGQTWADRPGYRANLVHADDGLNVHHSTWIDGQTLI